MALNKVNLVRLKSGNAPSQGSVVVYEAGSTGLYNTKASGDFVDEISPQIKGSAIYNDIPFLHDGTQAVKYAQVENNTIAPVNQVLNLGSHNEHGAFDHGAYAEYWTSELAPDSTSGKHGDLWFVIG